MKIKIVAGDRNHIQLEPLNRKKIRSKLKEKGITFVESNPDMILYHTYKAPKPLKISVFDSGIPVMILERVASAHINSTKPIQSDNVVGVLKSTSFRDSNINNIPYQVMAKNGKKMKSKYHSKLIYESLSCDMEYTDPRMIPPEFFNKVELWYNFACYKMMNPYVRSDKSLNMNRPLDLGFIGTTKYGDHSKSITFHRTDCMKKIKKLKNVKTEIYPSRISGKQKYINNILNCKIGISPWGLGEKCYRDFEIIYGGGILLKPDTSFVVDSIDSYNLDNNYYVPCEINFSDLQSKVDDILSNWKKYSKQALLARKKLISKCRDDNEIANLIFNVFTNCSKRII